MIKDKELLLKYRSKKSVDYYDPTEPCPCCGYITLESRGENLVCPVCFWEDEFANDLDIDNSEYLDGPNHMTLREAKLNFKKTGAMRHDLLSYVIHPEDRDKIFFIGG
ncbi:MAG: hypothetical protein C3F02_00485 [Parcubacteria group bacterium]|nr:MAG: hypothetical protein C3F02_00485 [Parcubacteria group bacterium]